MCLSGAIGRSTGLGGRDLELGGGLGGVRVRGAGVHLELQELLATERALGEHATDRLAQGLFGLAGVQMGVGLGLDAARVAAVAVHHGAVGLAGRHDDLVGVDDDHVIAGVDVGRVGRLVLAAQDAGDLGAEPAEDETVRVDDVPCTLDFTGFGGVRRHAAINLSRVEESGIPQRGTVK